MATSGVQGPQLSADGHWWWDGQAWQPVQAPTTRPATPQPAVQLSPDGHYWWDGQAWQPVQAAAPQAAPVSVPVPAPAAQKPDWLDQPPSWLAAQPAAASAREPVAQEAAPAPLWQQPAPRSSSRPVLIVAAALLVAVLAVGGLVVRTQLLNSNTDSSASTQSTPTPLLSDYERADRFLNVDLGPSLTETTNALPAVQSNCTSSLPPSCKDALMKLDKAMVAVQDAMTQNQRDIPACIGPAVSQFKADWNGMEQGVSQAIQGYTASSHDLIVQGLQKFASIAQYMQPDVNRINSAEQTCKK